VRFAPGLTTAYVGEARRRPAPTAPSFRRTARSPDGEPVKMLKVSLKSSFNRDPDRVATQQLLSKATAPRTQPASQHLSAMGGQRHLACKLSEAPGS
jgi:hypothetical protein